MYFRTWNVDGVHLLKIHISVDKSYSKWMLVHVPGCKFSTVGYRCDRNCFYIIILSYVYASLIWTIYEVLRGCVDEWVTLWTHFLSVWELLGHSLNQWEHLVKGHSQTWEHRQRQFTYVTLTSFKCWQLQGKDLYLEIISFGVFGGPWCSERGKNSVFVTGSWPLPFLGLKQLCWLLPILAGGLQGKVKILLTQCIIQFLQIT